MQTLTAYFLEQELPEIREAISTMEHIDILSEAKEPNSDLVLVTMLMIDAGALYNVGAAVVNNRYTKAIMKTKPDLDKAASNFFNNFFNNIKP